MGTFWGASRIRRFSLPPNNLPHSLSSFCKFLVGSNVPHSSFPLQISPCVSSFFPVIATMSEAHGNLLTDRREQRGLPVTKGSGTSLGHVSCPREAISLRHPICWSLWLPCPRIPRKDPVSGQVRIHPGLEEALASERQPGFRNVSQTIPIRAFPSRNKRGKERKKIGRGRWRLDRVCSRPDLNILLFLKQRTL